jgi:carbamoyl-phosphate synthase large subunit
MSSRTKSRAAPRLHRSSPSIDYVVTKIPRFAFEKFPTADSRLTTQMKSVGEVMAMGRTFQESFQKALRGLEVGVDGMNEKTQDRETLEKELGEPGPERIWYVGDAFAMGLSVDEVHDLTKIDKWFLVQIEQIVKIELELDKLSPRRVRAPWLRWTLATLRTLKQKGFSDRRLAKLLKTTEKAVREARRALGCALCTSAWTPAPPSSPPTRPTCIRPTRTSRAECEAAPTGNKKIMVLGGGPNRIGQGIEFDYCCVHAALAMREDGYETIMVNCNPETVSTDYDTSDRLYFEPVTLEDVLEIVDKEKPVGVIVQYGGQTPLKLALGLEAEGVPIIGTTPDMIDAAEDRERFQKLLHDLGLRQPPNATARTEAEALEKAAALGYPLVVRPSYVLGGRAMEIVHEQRDLERYMREAVKVSNDSPVLLDRFLNDAIECDVDCVRDSAGVTFIGGVMEHIEQAGVHSGDSACSLPPYYLSQPTIDEIKRQTAAMAGRPECGGPDERAVRHPGSGRQGRDLRAGSEPPRLAHGAVRFQGHRHPAGQGGGTLHGRPDAGFARHHQGSHAAVLQREGSRVPVRQVPRRGHHPRPRDEVHRRSDGRGQDLWRSLREEPAGRGHQAADLGQGVPHGEEQRQATRGGHRPPAGGAGL